MIAEIWQSFRRIPLWVQIWIVLLLVPVNLWPLLYWDEPFGLLVAALSVGGMLPNLFIMMAERGLSKRMALPHLVIWTPLALLIGWILLSDLVLSDGYQSMLIAVLVIDLVSLAFDFGDGRKWWRGDKSVA